MVNNEKISINLCNQMKLIISKYFDYFLWNVDVWELFQIRWSVTNQ